MDKGTTCAIDGCEAACETRGWCSTHYQRWRAHGTPDAARPVRHFRAGGCEIPGCDRKHKSRGWCAAHYRQWRLYGDPTFKVVQVGESHPRWAGDDVTYDGAHGRVRRARGLASDHECANCGGAAAEWAYDHEDPAEKHEVVRTGYTVPYSLDVKHYKPLCVLCHRRADSRTGRAV